MEAVYNNEGVMIGDVDECEGGGGWFATLIDKDTWDPIVESFRSTKEEAINWIKATEISFSKVDKFGHFIEAQNK